MPKNRRRNKNCIKVTNIVLRLLTLFQQIINLSIVSLSASIALISKCLELKSIFQRITAITSNQKYQNRKNMNMAGEHNKGREETSFDSRPTFN